MSDTIVCIAGGPSLTAAQVAHCRGRADVLVVNDGYRLAPWAKWLYACDYQWWNHHVARVRREFRGQCWTRDQDAARAFDLYYIESRDGAGLCRDPFAIYEGLNSGYQAINLAYHFGARRIVLLGYDMGATGNTHWFGEHPTDISSCAGARSFDLFLARFPALAADLEAAGVDVVNCTPRTALTAFRRAELVDVL